MIVPIANRSIPIIEDEYVDREFGTGCLKILQLTILMITLAKNTTLRLSISLIQTAH